MKLFYMKKFLILVIIFISYGFLYAQEESSSKPESQSNSLQQDRDKIMAQAMGEVSEEVKTTAENKISLDLKGVEVTELFKILSVKSGLTIITTPEVKGRVTVFLNNLSFDDTLEVILTMQNLACEKTANANIIKIMTAAEYEQAFGKKYTERKKVKTVKLRYAKPSNVSTVITTLKSEVGKIIVDEPSGTIILIDTPQSLELMQAAIKDLDVALETAVFDINYASSTDIKTYLTDLMTPGVGQVIIDQRSNKAIVSDLPERLTKIKKLMLELDETSRQVLITGEIVQVVLNDKFQRGIDWEHLLSDKAWHGLDLVGKFPLNPALSTNYARISVGTLASDDYSLVMNLLQECGKVSILSKPQIVAVNKEEAKIMVGSKEAYITQQQSQAQSSTVTSETVEFMDVGVKLKVTPTINKDGFITMKIKPEVSSVKETLTTAQGSKIPIIETSETETVVKVKNGSMIMIGGLIKKDYNNNTKGLPLLSKIPFLGGFFSTQTKEEERSELVLFLSPRLISGDERNPTGVVVSEKKKN